MAARRNPIDWEALETAVERNSPDVESFLETNTGKVLSVVRGDPDAAQLKAKIADDIEHYVRVEPASSREQYRWMERFVGSVVEEALQRRLVISIDGKGAFRRFKDVLLAYPAERERWFSYRADLLHWHIQSWLQNIDMEGEAPPPWGEIEAPEELDSVGETPITSRAPGESLRRQARELIDGIAPMELPSAIAFLEFLQERGGQVEVELEEPDLEPEAPKLDAELDQREPILEEVPLLRPKIVGQV